MRFRTSTETALRVEPKPDAEIKRMLPEDTAVGEGVETEDRKWLKVAFGNRDDQNGFVLAADCKDMAGERRDIPRGAVVDTCVRTELRFNASNAIMPWVILADFLVARAIIETGITNAGPKIPDSDATGPMQVSKAEWNDFVLRGGELARHRDETDRQDPIRQIDAAGFRMHSDLKAISALRSTAGEGDPFIPSYLDAFFAYLTDSPAAALAIFDAHSDSANHDQSITTVLRRHLSEDDVTRVHKKRSKFFGTKESPKSLKEAVKGVETELDAALKQAFEDIKEFMPEAIPTTPVLSGPERIGAGATFVAKAPGIMRALMTEFGFKDFQAGGILGNLGHETAGFTLMQERHPRAGRGGFGWAQWTGPRRVKFEKFCQDQGLAPTSDEGNLGFLVLELKTTEKGTVKPLKETTTLEEAVAVFEDKFERAGVVALAHRVTWARRAMAAFSGAIAPAEPARAGTARGRAARAGSANTVVQQLQQQIALGKITFQAERFRNELLGLNTGIKVSPKMQLLVLKLSELASPIQISSMVRLASAGHHGTGRAVDIGNEGIATTLLPLVATDQQVAALEIDELIFDAKIVGEADRNKWNYDQGHKHNFNTATLDDHRDHIHFAVKA